MSCDDCNCCNCIADRDYEEYWEEKREDEIIAKFTDDFLRKIQGKAMKDFEKRLDDKEREILSTNILKDYTDSEKIEYLDSILRSRVKDIFDNEENWLKFGILDHINAAKETIRLSLKKESKNLDVRVSFIDQRLSDLERKLDANILK